ncbi:DUF6328 family protein [Nocardioides sp. B-3]|uniref:DUF6328 family protein n=1 Tax=Nocardioides sp. B-3 TaxID=2895565 RepID=UPI002152575E|nr:DUF6328 family protein [Nocardioides sp. B-3]UUZ60928.1 DUF6328 family protein [Nocardioides sp. B-3]
MARDDRPGRDETPEERADRHWSDLLRELRVSQTGVQLLAAFPVSLPFQSRFTDLDAFQQRWYVGVLALALLTLGGDPGAGRHPPPRLRRRGEAGAGRGGARADRARAGSHRPVAGGHRLPRRRRRPGSYRGRGSHVYLAARAARAARRHPPRRRPGRASSGLTTAAGILRTDLHRT